MILSAAMMLDWLGRQHEIDAMVADGARLRRAVDRVVAKGTARTRDLGGEANTEAVGEAVLRELEALQ
jgi:3-isopropylmalate dehydrogenase